MEPKFKMETRAGCHVAIERIGPSVGVTIANLNTGANHLFACGADEAREISLGMRDVAHDEGIEDELVRLRRSEQKMRDGLALANKAIERRDASIKLLDENRGRLQKVAAAALDATVAHKIMQSPLTGGNLGEAFARAVADVDRAMEALEVELDLAFPSRTEPPKRRAPPKRDSKAVRTILFQEADRALGSMACIAPEDIPMKRTKIIEAMERALARVEG